MLLASYCDMGSCADLGMWGRDFVRAEWREHRELRRWAKEPKSHWNLAQAFFVCLEASTSCIELHPVASTCSFSFISSFLHFFLPWTLSTSVHSVVGKVSHALKGLSSRLAAPILLPSIPFLRPGQVSPPEKNHWGSQRLQNFACCFSQLEVVTKRSHNFWILKNNRKQWASDNLPLIETSIAWSARCKALQRSRVLKVEATKEEQCWDWPLGPDNLFPQAPAVVMGCYRIAAFSLLPRSLSTEAQHERWGEKKEVNTWGLLRIPYEFPFQSGRNQSHVKAISIARHFQQLL